MDFDIKDGKAVGVYIIKGGGFNADFGKVGANVSASLEKVNLPKFDNKHIFWDLNEAKANLLRPNIHSVKFWLLLFLVLNFFVMLDLFPNANSIEMTSSSTNWTGWIFSLIVISILLWASFCLDTLAKTQRLFKYIAIVLVSFVAARWLGTKIIEWIGSSIGMGLAGAQFSPSVPYFKFIFFVICGVVMIVCAVKWVKLLSQMTNQKAYIWALRVALVCAVIACFLGIIAWGTALDSKNPNNLKEVIEIGEYAEHFITFAYFIPAALVTWATLRFREIKQID